MKHFRLKKNEKGFTLIELILVIVILGILAAVAIPRFVDLEADARLATMEGLGGAIAGSITLLHAQYLLNRDVGTSTYDATEVIQNLDTSNIDGIEATGGAVITATIDGVSSTWTYTGQVGVAAARIAGPN